MFLATPRLTLNVGFISTLEMDRDRFGDVPRSITFRMNNGSPHHFDGKEAEQVYRAVTALANDGETNKFSKFKMLQVPGFPHKETTPPCS
ncbi:hypothetical protein EP7_005564 (plasmid) [Isosphaeraceae bacterium EP7]